MYYAKGVNLRVKMIAAAILMTLLVLGGGILGLRSLAQVMSPLEEIQVLVKDNTVLASSVAPQYEKAQAVYQKYRLVTIGVVLVALFVGVGIAIYFIRTVSDPLNRLVGAIQRVANGDLTVSLFTDRRDEVGQAIGAQVRFEAAAVFSIGRGAIMPGS